MLLDKLPSDSEYKKAISGRSGDWSEDQETWALIFNEVARMHHSIQALLSDPDRFVDYEPPQLLAPSEREAHWRELSTDDLEDISI